MQIAPSENMPGPFSDVIGVLLAGGKSRRMGQGKEKFMIPPSAISGTLRGIRPKE
ncbi:hypothetical protein DBW_3133 [Desulfuromonas sp. DDH964]|uniref:hypothetical protein n=1 Tax=Desulfuromonas sp. DDH964 TaxID=1823759 RepID=UPI00078E2486|nr:hypothetical protein [Desulfuromonas sp. DDH964]AMV73440.1 hypothetical protein DBW_3133 [Desulfuromonas sp. DDH964]